MTVELLPVRSAHRPGDEPQIEIRHLPEAGTLHVLHLGGTVTTHPVRTDGIIRLTSLPPGGYGIELRTPTVTARTAIEVLGPHPAPMRYGFVTDYRPGRDVRGVRDNIRRLHLTDVQFYDWAYRHADLVGGGEVYDDALGQPIDLATVRDLVAAVHGAGARALGYAAVYAVGPDQWPAWAHAALLTPTGAPYSLGDFLNLVDPADPGWLAQFTGDLAAAVASVGFDGFHLDQYGYPKHAVRPDGVPVTVAESFAALIAAARAALPDRRLVFNNVNNFPTWRTAPTAQDAVYIEAWPPHTTLRDLADLARDATAVAAGKPVVVAAYQHVYDTASAAEADRATAFTMATLFSHGAGHLLCGEADRILVDPYYVRNHTVEPSTAGQLRRWYDFLVEHGEVLGDRGLQDMTGALAGAYNDDCDVTYPGARVTGTPTADAIWRRILGDGDRLVVHLVNLCGQDDTAWDTPRKPIAEPAGGVLRVRRAGPDLPRVRVADPDRQAALRDLPVTADGDHATVALPAVHVWQVLVIDLRPSSHNPGE